MIMKEDYIMTRPLEEVNPARADQMKPLEQLTLDPMVADILNQLTPEECTKFREANRDFISNLCVKFRARYDFSQDHLLHMKFLEPDLALDPEFHSSGEYLTLHSVYEYLPGLINNRDETLIAQINDEWQRLPNHLLSEELLQTQNPVDFWHKLSLLKNSDDHEIFPALSTFALNCLTLPNSNAKSERIWSTFGWQVTDVRGNLYFQSKRAIMLSDEYIKFDGGPVKFEVTDEMLFNYLVHLNDPVKDVRHFKDPSTYMGEDITDELKEICRTEREFGKNLQRKLKIIIGSSNPSLDFTLSDFSQLEPETTENDTTMRDCTITHGEELDNTVPPTHIPAVSHIATPPVHQRNENVERYLHILPNGLLRNHTYYFTAIPVLPVIDPNRPTFRNY
ncbi:hypothetical protein QAD02_005490 [Eretmocerus hayati]|uniref:Uncharacterized protein n=1 Tax=Eretmocerus hayati TaxID=131215 RepID=A0ACC2NSN0_9HYME|nr:hypothetical protein QAD02_005490 [Eretmocerus hayati]